MEVRKLEREEQKALIAFSVRDRAKSKGWPNNARLKRAIAALQAKRVGDTRLEGAALIIGNDEIDKAYREAGR